MHKKSVGRILSIICGVGAPIVLFGAVLVAGSLHPDYSHISQPISALGAEGAPYRAILNFGGLIPAGVLTLLFSVMMFRNIKGSTALNVSAVLVALVGLGRFLAGIFPCDPGCLAFVSASAKIHAVAGMTALSAGVLAPLIFAIGLRAGGKTYLFYLSIVLGLGALTAIAAAISQLWPHYVGFFQRLLLIFTHIWIVVVAVDIGIKRDPMLTKYSNF